MPRSVDLKLSDPLEEAVNEPLGVRLMDLDAVAGALRVAKAMAAASVATTSLNI
jgi:hypothetical protein